MIHSRRTPHAPPISHDAAPVVPSLASSVPSIIASSTTDSPVITRSRSDADGEEPVSSSLVTSNQLPLDDTNRTVVARQPADGLGNPSTNHTTTWRARVNHPEQRVTSWDEDDDDRIPPSSRLRPVLIGGEDERSTSHSTAAAADDDGNATFFTNLSLDTQTHQ